MDKREKVLHVGSYYVLADGGTSSFYSANGSLFHLYKLTQRDLWN